MTFHFEAQLKILQASADGGAPSELTSELSGGAVSAPMPETPASLRGKRKAKARGS